MHLDSLDHLFKLTLREKIGLCIPFLVVFLLGFGLGAWLL